MKTTNQNIFSAYTLFNKEFDDFFTQNCLIKKTYQPNELINDTLKTNLVGYITRGLCKTYNTNEQGDEMFVGFLPRYSTMYSSPGLNILNKYQIACNETEIIYCLLAEYLDFLSQSQERILHSMYEPYYRRNLNDLPHYESINQSAKYKTYNYLKYIALRFGTINKNNSNIITIINPPSYKDIACFNGINANNVATFLSDLKRNNIIDKTKNKITILDLHLLKNELEKFKK